jgi:hypothetical protein
MNHLNHLNFDEAVFIQKERLEQSLRRLTQTFLEELLTVSSSDVDKQAIIEHVSANNYSQEFSQQLINQLN